MLFLIINRSEIPTLDVISHQLHLCNLPILLKNPEAQILLLIGRDFSKVHHVRVQRIGGRSTSFAQRTNLGWPMHLNVCFGGFNNNTNISSFTTNIMIVIVKISKNRVHKCFS